MISYRDMTQQDFLEYRSYSNEFRGRELADAQKISVAEGIQLANQELDECLPQGLETDNNFLLCLEVEQNDDTHVIGYFWYRLHEDSAFIYDFQIFPQYQGKGYGKQFYLSLDSAWSDNGINRVELLVAYDNKRAFKLYKEIGFQPTGINMTKRTISKQ
ncbi:GNAT family N-acetyltransferase [Photobacterium atrarenae]|uniref:GNAT family N-acetyltransferase n=1 Tax=Photobacterium atrarenae TaxID=865757 RepID=A0ABY5GIF4_9GAMM|nr:GNAT family N-acetyltransferase [Photobacterium atrarenae]UTV28936.1 GNAT family N-acetyltransferase [Photobacterium atrarenae]